MTDSKYQVAIYSAVASMFDIDNGALAVQAFAGSGKTTTSVKSFDYAPKTVKIMSCAFNKMISDEMQKKVPSNVVVKTLNAFGWSLCLKNSKSKIELNASKTGDILKECVSKEAKYFYGASNQNH
jgi:hypothetical protein